MSAPPVSPVETEAAATAIAPAVALRPEDPAAPAKAALLIARADGEAGETGDIIDLTPEERAEVDRLAARDREVRAHEQAHAVAGGPYAGEPRYVFEIGPDARRYAVAGEVSIDTSPVAGDPEATISKMEVVKAAALAPAEPSPQDRRVAQIADAVRRAAEAELSALRAEALTGERFEGVRPTTAALEGLYRIVGEPFAVPAADALA
ncbi:MAG: putative metalloprotease CJM1_0395 family protein [Pseudomonadota bacterium]